MHGAVVDTGLLRLIPLLPLVGFLVAVTFNRAHGLVKVVAPLCVGVAFAITVVAVLRLVGLEEGARLHDDVYRWIEAGPFHADLAFRIDALSAVYAAWADQEHSVQWFRRRYLVDQSTPAYAAYIARGADYPDYDLVPASEVPNWVRVVFATY